MTHKEHDIVVLKVDLPNVPKGTHGTVVHVYSEGKAYIVEFLVGKTSELATLVNDQLE